MQLFPCPFCGARPETEFQFAAEAGKARPEGDVSDEAWADYLYAERNPKGAAREIWVHLTCGEYFGMERDTLSHAVAGAFSLRPA
jgi:sarcosine oxidase subunit delta